MISSLLSQNLWAIGFLTSLIYTYNVVQVCVLSNVLSFYVFQENEMLAGQPPGTVIKCITAQVIQTQQGPRIVLQGLTGSNFSSQQLTTIQQQVKQQLLKGKAIFLYFYCVEFKFKILSSGLVLLLMIFL